MGPCVPGSPATWRGAGGTSPAWMLATLAWMWRVSPDPSFAGSGSLRAKFELSAGPSKPATLAVQFLSEGSTLSGADVELVGPGYRLSLVKKRFATGRYLADC